MTSTVKYVNAVTLGITNGTYGGNPGGFVINTGEQTVYIAGDTALTWDMKLIPLTSGKVDLAILPIGDNFTMGYQDALLAAQFVECKKVMGCHFDTFPYITIDQKEALALFQENGIDLVIPKIGDTY